MHANLKDLDQWLANPHPGAEQVINSRTPYERVKDLRQQVYTKVRANQMSRYNSLWEEQTEDVKVYAETLRELLSAVQQMRKDLRQGKADPEEVMDQIGESMKGLVDLTDDAKAIDQTGRMATEMIDKGPAEWQDNQQSRFPVGGRGPEVTVAFLRGEEDSPLADVGAGDE